MVRMFVVVIVILARLAAIAADKDVVEIREAIDATVRDLPQGKRAWPDYGIIHQNLEIVRKWESCVGLEN